MSTPYRRSPVCQGTLCEHSLECLVPLNVKTPTAKHEKRIQNIVEPRPGHTSSGHS